MLKKLLITIMCIGAFAFTSTKLQAKTVINITDEPVEDFEIESNTDYDSSEKDDIYINEDVVADIVIDNSQSQKETFKEVSNISNVTNMAENNKQIGIDIDTQCYLALQKEGKEHREIMAECSNYNASKIKENFSSSLEKNKTWFEKVNKELFTEDLFEYISEIFKGFFG